MGLFTRFRHQWTPWSAVTDGQYPMQRRQCARCGIEERLIGYPYDRYYSVAWRVACYEPAEEDRQVP